MPRSDLGEGRQAPLSSRQRRVSGFHRNIETKNGDYHSGFITKRTQTHVELRLATGQTHRIATKDIESNQSQSMSLMPEGMLNLITEQEAADLVAFLVSLKTAAL